VCEPKPSSDYVLRMKDGKLQLDHPTVVADEFEVAASLLG
jgi:hypothetical protein